MSQATSEEIWKPRVVKEHAALLAADCSEYFLADGDPVAGGAAAWVPCVFCGADDFVRLFSQQAYGWERCASCGLLQKRPRPTPEALRRFYQQGKAIAFYEENVIRADRDLRQEKIFAPYLERLGALAGEKVLADGAILDIGCSSGLFLAELRRRGWFARHCGVEANAEIATIARGNDIEVFEGMFEQIELPEGAFDVVACFTTFQLMHDPLAFLRKSCSLLKPGGALVLTGPNGWAPDVLLLGDTSPALPGHILQIPDPGSFATACSAAGFAAARAEAIGRFDVEIVRKAWKTSPPPATTGAVDFLVRLFAELSPGELESELQALLARHGLSGHLWMEARRD